MGRKTFTEQYKMTDVTTDHTTDAVTLAADILAAYVRYNSLPSSELPVLLSSLHRVVADLSERGLIAPRMDSPVEVEKATPAQIRKSITPDAIISFIDGKGYKTMKRHIGKHGLDPLSYRQRYGLPSDYPMVAPNYAAHRSALAKSIGLGRPGGMVADENGAESVAKGGKPSARKIA